MRLSLSLLLLGALAACTGPVPAAAQVDLSSPAAIAAVAIEGAREDAGQVAAPAVASVQEAAAGVLTPVLVDVREAVQELVPPRPAAPAAFSPAAIDLIVRWEVSGQANYTRRLEWPIWPGGASGVTWGIGYDGGHQTRQQIGLDWAEHDRVVRLQTTAGITGHEANVVAGWLRDVRTPFGFAADVFSRSSLPAYRATARRAFGPDDFDALSLDAQGALVSLVYNRGALMVGDRRREMRVLRDDCVPKGDNACIAQQLRSMCRLWRGTPAEAGLCARREDEARLAEGTP